MTKIDKIITIVLLVLILSLIIYYFNVFMMLIGFLIGIAYLWFITAHMMLFLPFFLLIDGIWGWITTELRFINWIAKRSILIGLFISAVLTCIGLLLVYVGFPVLGVMIFNQTIDVKKAFWIFNDMISSL